MMIGLQPSPSIIPDDFDLPVGSTIRIDCHWQGDSLTSRSIQWATIESNLKQKYPNFDVISYTNKPDVLEIEIKIIQPVGTEQVQTAGITPGMILIALGLMAVISTAWAFRSHTTYLYSQTRAGQMESASKFMLAVSLVLVVAWAYRKK